MKKEVWCVAFLVCAWVAMSAAAAPVGAAYTYQLWTFDDDDNPALPESYDNAYGDPLASFTASSPDPQADPVQGPWWYSETAGRSGVWYGHPDLNMSLEIPNRPLLDGYKDVWIEVGFKGYLGGYAIEATPEPGVVELLDESVTYEQDDWRTLVIGWRLYPNPEGEYIVVTIENTGALIDYTQVDTVCVPEPLSVVLLGFGSLGLVWKRRGIA